MTFFLLDVKGPCHRAKVQNMDKRPQHCYSWLPKDQAGRRGSLQMRNRERTWDGGARIQFICHRYVK